VLVDADAHIVANEGDWLTEVARLEVGEPAAVVCIENTHTRRGGTVLTAAQTAELASRARCAASDAAVALGVPLAELAAPQSEAWSRAAERREPAENRASCRFSAGAIRVTDGCGRSPRRSRSTGTAFPPRCTCFRR
jgi:hypothetical protein